MNNFPLLAAAFEGSLVVLAIALGRLLGTRPLGTFQFDLRGALWGIGGTLPPLALFWLCLRYPLGPLKQIARIVDETLVPLFRDCRIVQLAIIAALAGLGEETLFRGVVQTGLTDWIGGEQGLWLGLLAAAVLFGLLHTITPTYAVIAGLIGLYLGWLWLLADKNLLAPVVSHGLYDFLVLVYFVKVRSKGQGARDQGQGT